MTEDLEDLIERIKRAHDDELRAVIALFAIEDPVERFRFLDMSESEALAWAIPRAKAITIEEMKTAGKSYEEIGGLLGLSRQRVHQLANPEPRRSDGRKKRTRVGAD